jgi:hypothetical protein
MNKNNFHDPNAVQDFIKKIENATGAPFVDVEKPQDVKIQFRVDETVPPAKFKPDPIIPGGYIANSLTIRSMRENIFVVGESLDDLVNEVNCISCNTLFDLQFWKNCPYCGKVNNVI